MSSREQGGKGAPSGPSEWGGPPARVNTLSYMPLSGSRQKPPPSEMMPSASKPGSLTKPPGETRFPLHWRLPLHCKGFGGSFTLRKLPDDICPTTYFYYDLKYPGSARSTGRVTIVRIVLKTSKKQETDTTTDVLTKLTEYIYLKFFCDYERRGKKY